MEHALSPVEAHRVIAVLEETLEKLTFLDSITPDVLAHRDELAALVGDEIGRIISEQRTLERRYEALIKERGVLKGLANKTKYKEVQVEIKRLSHALRESTKHLCRNLKDNPNIGENLFKIQRERERLQDLLGKTVQELRGSGGFSTLVAQVREEQAAQERLAQIVHKERETAAAVAKLDEDLAREQEEHTQEMEKKQATIRKLKDELHRIKLQTSVDGRCARMEATAKTNSKQRVFKQAEVVLEQRVSDLESKKQAEDMVHAEMARFLRVQQQKLSSDVESWNARFKEDLDAKEEELKRLKEDRKRDLEELNALQERYDRDLARQAKQEEEQRRQAELEKLQAEENLRKRVAATLLQRGLTIAFQKRQAADAGKKKKKGKKGKKGKKKKKK